MLVVFVLLIALFGTVSTTYIKGDPQLLWVFSFFGAIAVMGSPRPAETIATGVGLLGALALFVFFQPLTVALTLIGLTFGAAFLLALFFGLLAAALVALGVHQVLVKIGI